MPGTNRTGKNYDETEKSYTMNIGFISTRFAGTDGVSLEAAKWGKVLASMGHACYWYAGETDLDDTIAYSFPQAFFGHSSIKTMQKQLFGSTVRSRELSTEIIEITGHIKESLYDFVHRFTIDLLIPQNALTIPMHVPLGLAITQFICETGMKCIAHHHDFAWERQRFTINAIPDYLAAAFPPRIPQIEHVCINSIAARQLAFRTGLSSTVIPNVIDFDAPYSTDDDCTALIKAEMGLSDNEYVILQPARIVPRKGIENAIELVRQLNKGRLSKQCVLVFSHSAGDEGMGYYNSLMDKAEADNVKIVDFSQNVGVRRGVARDGKTIYTLEDVYKTADFVTYPSIYEGFGNAFLETVYFRKPLLVNRYSVYETDIEPLGFDCVMIDQYLTREAVSKVEDILEDKGCSESVTEHNFQRGREHFSFKTLHSRLAMVLAGLTGESS